MREVILELVNDDHRAESRRDARAGDAGKRRGLDDGRQASVLLEDVLLGDLAPPEHLGFGHVEFVVVFLADFLVGVRVGGDRLGNDDLVDDDLEVLGKALGLGAAGAGGAGLGLGVRVITGGGGRGFAECQFIELELELVGIELLRTRAEEPLLEAGDDAFLPLDLIEGECQLAFGKLQRVGELAHF